MLQFVIEQAKGYGKRLIVLNVNKDNSFQSMDQNALV